jgi:CheY-like chemotaxis protein
VVNGSPPFLDLMRVLLQDERYNATTTNYVPRTIDQIVALRPDLLVIDLVIGVQAGWDLLDALRAGAITHGIPIIVTSTNQNLLDRARAEQKGFESHRYIVMPFDIDDMLKAIDSLIGTAETD